MNQFNLALLQRVATLLRSFPVTENWEGTKSYYFYKSTDNGRTWSFLSELDPEDFGFSRDKQGMPGMFVFPQTLGDFPAGTIIFANNDWSPESEYVIHIWRSTDNGVSWEYHSSLGSPRGAHSLGTGICGKP